jgi:diacylglycerol kinase family enzyme
MTRIPILRNEKAGTGGADDALRDAFEAAGARADLRSLPVAQMADEAFRLLREGARTIGVSGGDGTVSAVAGALAGTEATLAVFPGGTLNHFAAALGIRTHRDALRALAAGRACAVDVGEVNGRVFINGASIGLYPRQLRIRQAWQPRIGKWPAAALAGVLTLAGFPRRPVTIQGGGLSATRSAPLVWIGPGRGSFRDPVQAPRELQSATLELVVIGAASRMRLLAIGVEAALRGRDGLRVAEDAQDCTVHLADRFTLATTRPRLDVGVDGELVRLPAPLEFRVRPGALRVLVAPPLPPDPDEGQGAST